MQWLQYDAHGILMCHRGNYNGHICFESKHGLAQKHIGQHNCTADPDINICIYKHSVFDKKYILEKILLQQTVLEKLGIYMQMKVHTYLSPIPNHHHKDLTVRS